MAQPAFSIHILKQTDQSIHPNSYSIYHHHPVTQIVHPKSAWTNTMCTLAINKNSTAWSCYMIYWK